MPDPKDVMVKLIRIIEKIVIFTGKWSAWLNLALVILICMDVLLRYFFKISANWIIELEWHLFGLIFLLGSAYGFKMDKHVRVDLFYNKWSEKTKAVVDLAGTVLLLIPWCLVCIHTCYKYASNAWFIREKSPNPDGLPALYIIKYFVVLGFVLLMLQGFAVVYHKIRFLKTGEWSI